MEKSILCGKNMGIADTPNSEFEDPRNRQTCFNCHLMFVRKIKPQIDNMLMAGLGIEKVVEEVTKDYSIESKEFVRDYIYFVESIEKPGEVSQKISDEMANFKCTTGYNFEGYNILEYRGIVSGEVVLGTGFMSEFSAGFSDFFGTQSKAFADEMSTAKREAQKNLIKNAVMFGANALIGVDFDYITFNNNILGVSANGTAVVIEKIEE